MTREWLSVWSAFVGIFWVALAAILADDETCSFICFTFSDLVILLFIPAAIVWSLGVIVLYIVGRLRGRRSSSDTGATTGTH